MALERQNLTRVFIYSGVRLPDPDAGMQPVAVRDFFAAAGRPELSSAEVRGPEIVGNEQQFTLHRAVGTKGLQATAPAVIDTEAIKVPDWITQRLKAFDKAVITAEPEVNELISILAKRPDGDCIQPPAQAIRWFF